MMTLEEKAKAYDEALKKMRPLYEQAKKDDNPIWSTYEYLFPQLRESEGEKMTRVIGLALTDVPEERFTSLGTTLKDCLAYLEKQKEQKSKFNVGDTIRLKNSYAEYTIESISDGRYYCKGCSIDIDGCDRDYELVRQKPAEWTEEDEKMLKWLCRIVHSQRVNKVITLKEESELGKWMDKWFNHNPCLQGQKDDKCISPEEGDIVVNKYGEISVFENWGHHPDGGSFNDKTYFFAKCTLVGDNYDDYDCHPDSEGLRYATPEEIRKIMPYLLNEKV